MFPFELATDRAAAPLAGFLFAFPLGLAAWGAVASAGWLLLC